MVTFVALLDATAEEERAYLARHHRSSDALTDALAELFREDSPDARSDLVSLADMEIDETRWRSFESLRHEAGRRLWGTVVVLDEPCVPRAFHPHHRTEVLPPPLPEPRPVRNKKVLSVAWVDAQAWCSRKAFLTGTIENYSAGETLELTLHAHQGGPTGKLTTTVTGDSFAESWMVKDVLPTRSGAHFTTERTFDVLAGDRQSEKPLRVRFAPNVKRLEHHHDGHVWSVSASDFVITLKSQIPFVPGWGGEVVKLGNRVPPGTGGLLDGQFIWPGYRWMKGKDGKKYWDGSSWQDLPAGFVLDDNNNLAVGFYKRGPRYVCQHGGTWPDSFKDWSVDEPDPQQRLADWTRTINETWSEKIDLKRSDCKSTSKACCRYKVKASVMFVQATAFDGKTIIVARHDIRSNDMLFFLGDPRLAMAAHEFGHHIGNADEYAGATGIDTSLNGDGAVKGIDRDSIMGTLLTKVKVRHLQMIAQAFSDAVRADLGETFAYVPVLP